MLTIILALGAVCITPRSDWCTIFTGQSPHIKIKTLLCVSVNTLSQVASMFPDLLTVHFLIDYSTLFSGTAREHTIRQLDSYDLVVYKGQAGIVSETVHGRLFGGAHDLPHTSC